MAKDVSIADLLLNKPLPGIAGVTDHGALTGLGDDDHTQYTKKATLTEQGDLYYASAPSTPAALVHGITGEILVSGGHGANPSWTGAINLTGDSSIAIDKKFLLEGAGSDSYIIYNSTTKKVELYVDGVLVNSWGNNGLKMLMDGTTAIKDLITPPSTAFTMTGGVSNEFTTAANWTNDNFRTLLNAQAPVIAQATTNKLTYASDNSTFEGNTVGGWLHGSGGVDVDNCTIAVSTAQAWHGTHSLAQTAAGNGAMECYRNVLAVTTAAQHTISARFKGVVGKGYRIWTYGDVSGATIGAIITADGTWQTATVTATFAAGDTYRYVVLMGMATHVANDVVYWDAIQIETGAVQTPYCVDVNDDAVTRTACKMTIPVATIGMTAGMPLSVMCVVNTPWAGDDGLWHFMIDIARNVGGDAAFSLRKTAANNLEIETATNAPAYKRKRLAVTSASWAPNTPHVVITTLAADNTQRVFLDGNEGTVVDGAGAREEALYGNLYIGTQVTGNYQLNGAILCAIWGRVLTAAEIAAMSAWTLWTSALTCGPAIGSTYFDDVNDRFYVYTSNGWRYAALT